MRFPMPTATRVAVKTILLATDFSAASEAAMNYAVGLACYYDSKLITAHVVWPMQYFSPEPAVSFIEQMDAGAIHGIVFTSSPQIDRLWEVARERGLEPTLQRGMARTQVSAVGPLVAESLHQHGVVVHVCPEQGWVMKNLVKQIARAVPAS